MAGQTSGNSPLFATVHWPFKVAAEKGKTVGLIGKKEGRQKRKNSRKELANGMKIIKKELDNLRYPMTCG